MLTIRDLLSAGDDDQPALDDIAGRSLTFRQLREKVDSLAQQLAAVGIGASDRIAIVLPNGPEAALVTLAATSLGCAAPLNPKYRESEFRFYMDDLGVRALILPEGGHHDAEAAAQEHVEILHVRGEMSSLSLLCPDGTQPSRSLQSPSADDHALVLHTSGTTSRPKIVPLRQRNLVASARNIAASLGLTPFDASLNVMPLFHIHGLLAGLLAPLSVGGRVICTTGFDAFKFHGWVDSLRPTYYSAVPTMHQMVLARAEKPGATSLRFVRSSSAPLPNVVLEGLRDQFGVPVIEAYGMTEASHQMASNPLPPGVAKAGSVGLATGIDVAVLASDGSIVPPGSKGEVSVRGRSIVDGYENNEDANRSSFTEDGWFRTGDEGYVDEDGYLFLTGRLKEQINRGGEKVAPLEIDEVLMSHPAVAQAVVFAVTDSKLGEEVAAAIVLNEGAVLNATDIRAYASSFLAAFKVPRHVYFVEEIPKGPTGKVQRIGLAQTLGVE